LAAAHNSCKQSGDTLLSAQLQGNPKPEKTCYTLAPEPSQYALNPTCQALMPPTKPHVGQLVGRWLQDKSCSYKRGAVANSHLGLLA
jgi:hypothetical protein